MYGLPSNMKSFSHKTLQTSPSFLKPLQTQNLKRKKWGDMAYYAPPVWKSGGDTSPVSPTTLRPCMYPRLAILVVNCVSPEQTDSVNKLSIPNITWWLVCNGATHRCVTAFVTCFTIPLTFSPVWIYILLFCIKFSQTTINKLAFATWNREKHFKMCKLTNYSLNSNLSVDRVNNQSILIFSKATFYLQKSFY